MTAGPGKRRVLLAVCLCGTLLFASLGVWQVQRLAWKRDLIARVDARVRAAPVSPPTPQQWPALDLHDWEYRRVRLSGRFLHDRETLVDAVTALGPGAWVLTPLATLDAVVLVNRGFVPPELKDAARRAAGQVEGEVTVTGLLRRTEPGGRILRRNDPAAGRWFSRDVAAIAAARGLHGAAPFFVDAEADGTADVRAVAAPHAGLTVVHFRNAHLTYALTWSALAALCIAGVVLLLSRRHEAPSRT